MNAKPRTAAEWAVDISDMLLTYSRNPIDVVAFAADHGVVSGIWVEQTDGLTITAENGWSVTYDGRRFVAQPPTRDVTTTDTYPAPGITVRTVHEDGAFVAHVLFVGGMRVGEYKTDCGLSLAIECHRGEAARAADRVLACLEAA